MSEELRDTPEESYHKKLGKMIKDFNQECDDIINKKQKKLDYSHELAGRVFEELRESPEESYHK